METLLHRKLTSLFSSLLGLLFLAQSVHALDISIDGVLDETDWSNAREVTKFYESMPFSLGEPKHFQKVPNNFPIRSLSSVGKGPSPTLVV